LINSQARFVRSLLEGNLSFNFRFLIPFIVLGTAWQLMAVSGVFPARLFPSLQTIVLAFASLVESGIVFVHAYQTLFRLLFGTLLGALIGCLLGLAMGTNKKMEDIFSPWVTIFAPIPGLAYAPLFMLWFGLGDISIVVLVGFVAFFPVVLNTWAGVKGVKELWIRSAKALGANDRVIFQKVIFPAALPHILTGLRLGLAQGWRILVAAEMLAAVPWGLGWLIFGAREFMNTDIMLAGIAVIGLTGLILEGFVFKQIERYTVVRWGMMTA
jgi:NitT/TauT family transport system permease protein